jgi:regulator of sirC expression with transglutaminase-like and TPR domain
VLEKGLDLAPYARDLYRALAQYYRALGHRDQMRKTLERYLELFPQDDAARNLLRSRP